MKSNIKEELIKILSPIFGEAVKRFLEEHYDSTHPEELIEVAHHMLSGYMGESNANKILKSVLDKYPKLKINA
jgi:hypothetical protein